MKASIDISPPFLSVNCGRKIAFSNDHWASTASVAMRFFQFNIQRPTDVQILIHAECRILRSLKGSRVFIMNLLNSSKGDFSID